MMNEETGELFLWSAMTSNESVYSVPNWNSKALVMTLFLIVMEADMSSSLMAMKIFRCFTGRFTEFSDSKLSNSTVIRVV